MSAFETCIRQAFEENGLTAYADKASAFEKLAELLKEGNQKVNVTAITDDVGIARRHIADCLYAAAEIPKGAQVADVGCGGGFPTLPLAIAREDLSITAIDATAKKLAFVEQAAAALALDQVTILPARAEALGRGPLRGRFDAVTARAVAALPVLVELCVPLLRVGGRLVALKGKSGAQELAEAQAAFPFGVHSANQGIYLVLPGTATEEFNFSYEKGKDRGKISAGLCEDCQKASIELQEQSRKRSTNMDKKLVVIKVGTSSLTAANGSADSGKIKICDGVADLRDAGYSVIVVSSGAIAAGFRRLGFSARPNQIPFEQASAAVGQVLLMDEYSAHLSKRGYHTAQILLTPDAFLVKEQYINAFTTLEILLKRGVIPIINENNTVATSEIRFGDNDTLSAQVAAMVHADRLVLLTDVDGLYTGNPQSDKTARKIEVIERITQEIETYASGAGSANGTGGMKTKVSAAKLATSAGVEVYICSSEPKRAVFGGVTGENKGTLFKAGENLKTRLQWMAFYAKSRGEILVDQGAAEAVGRHHRSLLLAGITDVQGDFAQGDVVDILTADAVRVARGFASYSAEEIRNFRQQGGVCKPIVHIDNMVVSTDI